MDKKITVGKIFAAHGIKGGVKFQSFTENPDTLFKLKPLYCGEAEIVLKRVGNGIAMIEGVTDRNVAETYRNRELWVWRSQLPETKEKQYYINDLIGMSLVDDEGELVGTVLAFHHFGAGDIMEITLPDGTTEMFGFEQVGKVDIEHAQLHLKPISDS